MLKILHPASPPSDEEFEEYVRYAIECRRRVKEQMNKRKTDDEFARIGLSYINSRHRGYVPESQSAAACEPSRRDIRK